MNEFYEMKIDFSLERQKTTSQFFKGTKRKDGASIRAKKK